MYMANLLIDKATESEQYLENIDENGVLLMGWRLKKVTDNLFKQVQDLYDKRKRNFKAVWFTPLITIYKNPDIELKTLAEKRKVTASAITQIVKELEKNNLVKTKKSKEDQRSKTIKITKKGIELLTSIIPDLNLIEETINELLSHDFHSTLAKLENFSQKLSESSFEERYIEKIKIIKYQDKYKKDFKELNESWFNPMFSQTDYDRKQFRNPQKSIIEKGGEIFLLVSDDELIGNICLIHHDNDNIEISKMCVRKDFQGLGLSKLLMNQAIEYAREKKYNRITLYTNSQLSSAIELYRKYNFIQETVDSKHSYGDRADMQLKLYL